MAARNDRLRLLWTGQEEERPCTHLGMINDVEPSADVCEACVAAGRSWPALRICLTCGNVGCCDDGEQHARRHFEETGHPLQGPFEEAGMDWIWCYADEALLDPR